MFKRINNAPRSNSPSRNNPRLSLLLSLMLCSQFVHADVAQAQDGRPGLSTVFTATTNAMQTPQEITTLAPGKPVERELAGGQKHRYQISLSEGQYVEVIIRREGVDVVVSRQLPSGETHPLLFEIFGSRQEMAMRQVAESSGLYRLDVFARAQAPTGRYEIRVAELRPATDSDRELQRARNLYLEYRSRQGRYLEARPLLIRALEIREKLLGPDDLLVAATLGVLAADYGNTGDYAVAEPLRLRQLMITEKTLGPDHPAMANVLNGLGGLYLKKGDYLKAEESYLKALAIFEKAHQAETNEVAALSSALGSIYYARGDYESAEKYYQRSRGVLEKIFGPDHFHLASSFTYLGRVAYDAGDYAKAEAMFGRALTLSEKALGQDHLGVTSYRNDLAMVYGTTGRHSKAEALYRQALSIHEQKVALSDPVVQETLYGLARLSAARGMPWEALKFQTRASELEERYVELNLAVGSERERLAFLDKLSLRSSRNISLHTRLATDDGAARDLAATTILQRKGRVQDAMSDSLAALRLRLGAEDQKLLDSLRDITSRLAKLVLNGPQKTTGAKHQEQVRALEEQRESLEAEISRRSAGFYERSRPATLDAVRGAIPDGAALVEFAVYLPFDPKAADNKTAYREPHYIAYVIRREGEVQWKELGEAESVDAAIYRWRKALRDPMRKDVRQLAQAVDEKVMRPVRALVGDATQLLVSPDGALNLIPFGALVDERGRYLVERYSLTCLTSGRELVRMQVKRESKSEPVVVADPAFGEPAAIASRVGAGGSTNAGGSARLDYSQMFFGPLPGVGGEVRALRELLPRATFHTKEQATESTLKRVRGPSILHVATHGFFLQNDGPATGQKATPTKAGTRIGKWAVNADNPLLRSGLALAGANQGHSEDEDGVLTALEATTLDLWGTKLVVLSACDTGVGEVRNSDGVYGFRRALVLAGAESQLMSLWPVSDRSTRDLMVGYYKGLVQNAGRGEALRRVQLQMLRSKTRGHPYYWASFILTGEWANLKGQRDD